MISQYFNSGNYNKWDQFVKQTLPEVNKKIRSTIIPRIDEALESMLGNHSNITKETINIVQDCNKILKGIYVDLIYFVPDWKVSEVPQKAVEEDERALKNYLASDEYTVEGLNIEVSSGKLRIQIYIPLTE